MWRISLFWTPFWLDLVMKIHWSFPNIKTQLLENEFPRDYFLQKQDNKISDRLAFLFLLYDTCQLGILLYLTGGIFNPFCILIIAPVIISASYLPVFWTIILSFFSIILIVFINLIYIPIQWQGIFFTPNIYKQGLVFALIITIVFIAVSMLLVLTVDGTWLWHFDSTSLWIFHFKNVYR